MGQIFHSCNTAWYCDSKTKFTLNTAEELAGLAKLVNAGNSFMGKTIMLGQNIAINNKKESWEPIGKFIYKGEDEESIRKPFNGTFDGKGFAVSGLYINAANDRFQGLFGCTSSNARIENLGITASHIKGSSCVGALAGINNGVITDCYASASVEGTNYVGGLVGCNNSVIWKCYSTGSVKGSSVGGLVGWAREGGIVDCYSSSSVKGYKISGGLVGENEDYIIYCYATGKVTPDKYGTYTAGGLAGENEGTITECYSTSTVIGKTEIGGLVGGNDGEISNCYFAGKIKGQDMVGGIAGLNYLGGTTSNSYSIGKVVGKKRVSGLVGEGDEIRAKRSFYNNETSGPSCGWEIEGKATAEMKRKATYCAAGWDFDKIWNISSKINGGYPHIKRMGK
jgi:hypothetical protein